MIIAIDPLSDAPLYEQLRDKVVLGIASKQLVPGETLPSVRKHAADLGINLHTVNKAYSMLSDEGYIVTDRRKGTLVAESIEADEKFSKNLSEKLLLAAAEAICHRMSKEEFLGMCAIKYNEASKGELKNG
jgi:DNA-binding transcriptional regulator YhcF (GntR family)